MRHSRANSVSLFPVSEVSATEDPTKTSKGKTTSRRAPSFKKNFLDRFTMKSPRGTSEKVIKVEAKTTSDGVDRKIEDVWRALKFYQDTVDKCMYVMLPGSATVVLEMVLSLAVILKRQFVNQNSSHLQSLNVHLNQSVAELVQWSNQFLLYGDDTHCSRTVQQVVDDVKQAVQAFVESANAAKKSDYYDLSDDSLAVSADDTLSSCGSCYSLERKSASFRNSMPDITSPLLENPDRSLPRQDQLINHSISSDSILSFDDMDVPPPKPPLQSLAPPLPPKRKHHSTHILPESMHNPCSPVRRSSPGYLFDNARDWNRKINNTSTPVALSNTANSSLQVSPASSVDSLSHPPEDFVSLRHSYDSVNAKQILRNLCQTADSFDVALNRNFSALFQDNLQQPVLNVPDYYLSNNQTFMSLSQASSSLITQNMHSFSQCSQASQMSYCQPTHLSANQFSSNVMYQCFSEHLRNALRCSVSSSSSCESDIFPSPSIQNGLCISVPPQLPSKRRQHHHGNHHYRSSSCSAAEYQDGCDTVDSSLFRMQYFDDSVPDIPPKKCSNSSGSSGYTSNTSSILSNASSSNGSCPANVILRKNRFLYDSEIDDNRPPLPPKKKNIMDYMECIGQYHTPSEDEFLRHSVHQVSYYHQMYYSAFPSAQCDHCAINERIEGLTLQRNILPPALPPKRNRQFSSEESPEPPFVIIQNTPPPPPPPLPSFSFESAVDLEPRINVDHGICEVNIDTEHVPSEKSCSVIDHSLNLSPDSEDPLDLLNVRSFLVLKKEGEEGPEIRGGTMDALVVFAAKANNNDFMYQEAFLTTYRTFIKPSELIDKLLKRYENFSLSSDIQRQKAAKNAFSLLVRIADDLTLSDLNQEILKDLADFEYTLLCKGELQLARVLRGKLVEKLELWRRRAPFKNSLTSYGVTTQPTALGEFKSSEIAAQMTLLDSELFQKVDIPEVLFWAREQNEELSPNLTTFTEHFNKMSYWVRSRILEQKDAKDRERYVTKFLKVMKHLRKLNNFNSYLAILSALDSSHIRRLEWQRNITDGIKEYCTLIDSSSSFRAYRQALAETTPPCIPYIQYNFSRNDKVIEFFNNFDEFLSEDALWDMSEKIKPRKTKQ